MTLHKGLADYYAGQIPARIVEYLVRARGLILPVIRRHKLGWNGSRITIPIFDPWGRLTFFKLVRSPEDLSDSPKMICRPAGNQAELYGWENLTQLKPELVAICEGEWDRLVLEAHGIPAVTGTAGAGVFLKEWAEALSRVPEVLVCYDRDETGRSGAENVASFLPKVKIVELPDEVGPGGDISDFFVRLGRSTQDFKELLAKAKPLPREKLKKLYAVAERQEAHSRDAVPIRSGDPRVQRIKEAVPIEQVAEAYAKDLRCSGRTLVGRCPFHDDRIPSLVLYPGEGRFHCYGCGTHGDVIQFLMEAECLSFPQALKVLEEYLVQGS